MTKKQSDFILHYVESRNAREACRLAGYTPKYCKSKAHLLLKNKEVGEKIAHLTESYYKTQFEELALVSIKELGGVIADSENRGSQLRAIQYVLSEAGVTNIDDSESGTIQIKITLPKELE